MKRLVPIVFILFFIVTLRSQDKPFVHSLAHVQTSFHNKAYFNTTESAIINYDETKKELSIQIDFKLFKTGIDSFDEWLIDLEGRQLIFIAEVDPELYPVYGVHSSKNLKTTSSTNLNQVTIKQECNMLLYEANDQGMMYRDYGNGKYDRFRVRIRIDIIPKDYKIEKLKHHLKNTISIYIGNGIINQIKY